MEMLKLRKEMKARKPEFVRQDAHKVKSLERKWRKPKGIHSKMRHKFKGYRKLVSKGYKSPADVRGLSGKGMEMILINNTDDLQKLNAKTQAAVIAKTVGMRKKLAIVDKANEMNIAITNLKDQKDFKAKFGEMRKKKLEVKQKITEKKVPDKAQPVKEEKAREKSDEKEAKDSVHEKKELDKLLTKPE